MALLLLQTLVTQNIKPHSGYLTLVGVPWHPTTASAWEHQHKVIQDTATWGLPPCSSESPNSWVKRTAPVGLRQRKEECRDKAGLFKTCFQVNQGFCLAAVHSAGCCHIRSPKGCLNSSSCWHPIWRGKWQVGYATVMSVLATNISIKKTRLFPMKYLGQNIYICISFNQTEWESSDFSFWKPKQIWPDSCYLLSHQKKNQKVWGKNKYSTGHPLGTSTRYRLRMPTGIKTALPDVAAHSPGQLTREWDWSITKIPLQPQWFCRKGIRK